MATLISRVTAVTSTVLVAVAALSACTPRPDGPAPAAAEFFAELDRGDTGAAAALSDRPSEAHEALNEAWTGLQATHLSAEILGSRHTEDTGSVHYRFTWELPKKRTWTYDGVLNMIRDEGRWQVRWSASALHPKLGEHQHDRNPHDQHSDDVLRHPLQGLHATPIVCCLLTFDQALMSHPHDSPHHGPQDPGRQQNQDDIGDGDQKLKPGWRLRNTPLGEQVMNKFFSHDPSVL